MDDGFGHWLAGFIDGEGCFLIHNGKAGRSHSFRLGVHQRADDLAILEEIQERTGIGRIYGPTYRSKGADNPCYEWRVSTDADLLAMLDLLDRFPLRAKKKRDYAIWRDAVLLPRVSRTVPGHGSRTYYARDWQRVEEFRAALTDGRKYDASAVPPAEPEVPHLFLVEAA